MEKKPLIAIMKTSGSFPASMMFIPMATMAMTRLLVVKMA